MIVRCLGGWADGAEHVPSTIGAREPLANTSVTDGACDRCCRAMGVTIRCRWCDTIETAIGLCGRCELLLERQLQGPRVELSVFRAGAEPLIGTYDGMGAILRLRASMKEPGYLGFAIKTRAEVAA